MKTLFRLIVLVLLIAGWGLSALSLHVVRAAGDHIVIIPKQHLGITDIYVDARNWKIDDVANHTALVERIIQSGKSDSFAYMVSDPKGNVEQQLEDALRSAPATKPDDLHHTARSIEKNLANHLRSHASAQSGAPSGASSSWFDFGN